MNIFINFLISTIGLGYFIYGKKLPDFHFLLFGIVLMFYSYFISSIFLSLAIGLALLIAPFLTKKLF